MKLLLTTLAALVVLGGGVSGTAQAHFLWHHKRMTLEQKVKYFNRSIVHDQDALKWLHVRRQTVGRWGAVVRRETRWHEEALRWHRNLLRSYSAKLQAKQTPVYSSDYWIAKQIRVATIIASEPGSNPWPVCPDPFHDGASWSDLVNCENSGNWYDSPGYYRCGLQFDPMWETRYGPLCP